MPRKSNREPAPTYPCDGTWRDPETGVEVKCQNTVSSRKPSESGKHFCPRPACQAAKQRHFRATRRRERDSEQLGLERDAVRALVIALAHVERTRCASCGLEDALPGWAHRAAPGSFDPCFGVGHQGRDLPGDLLDCIHPERRPQPVDIPPVGNA